VAYASACICRCTVTTTRTRGAAGRKRPPGTGRMGEHMGRQSQSLQDVFLNAVRRQEIPVTIYLVNGYQMKGLVKGFDSFTVILSDGTRQDLIYKHAISTITPLRPVSSLSQPERGADPKNA